MVMLRLAAALQGALEDPAVRDALDRLGIEPIGFTPDALDRLLAVASERWRRLIGEAGIRFD
jgi:tripartite-type tricarboxylate transporter receptor subunit TctC